MSVLNREMLRRSRLRFVRMCDHIRAILDSVREPFTVLDGNLRIRLANKSFCRTFRLSPKQINGRCIHELGDGAWKDPALQKWLGAMHRRRTYSEDLEVEGVFPVIGRRTILFNARRVEIAGASRHITLLTTEDITPRRQAEKEMKQLNAALKSESMTDTLTGLYNRRGYTVLSQHYLDLAHRRGKRVFVIYIDLDGLNKINDEGGHLAGDQALVRAADILRETFRKSDILARIGGDEFVIATLENGHNSAAIQMARLQINLKRHALENHYAPPISLSVGVARSNPRGLSSIEELTRQADALMYIEKRGKYRSDPSLRKRTADVS